MSNMLFINKNKLEELLQQSDDLKENVISESDLRNNSKEVEFKEIDEELDIYLKHYLNISFLEYCKKFGYKLIKIK